MATHGDREYSIMFPKMVNFREVTSARDDRADDHTASGGKRRSNVTLFRSARPDSITEKEVLTLKNDLGIKAIIDLRSAADYKTTSGDHLLDKFYPLKKVNLPKRKYVAREAVMYKNIKSDRVVVQEKSHEDSRSHYFINCFPAEALKYIFTCLPWYRKLYGLLLLIADAVLGTGFLYFKRVLATVYNHDGGIEQQYKDLIDYSHTSICAALKLLSDRENLPALLNCAIGKDRTGVVTALLLKLCGKSHDYIAADYAKSQEGLDPVRDRLRKELKAFNLTHFEDAKPETMRSVLQHVEDRYGSVENYCEGIGFSKEEQKRLKDNLLGR